MKTPANCLQGEGRKEINEVSIDPEKPHRHTLKDVFHSFHVFFFKQTIIYNQKPIRVMGYGLWVTDITWLPHCRLKFFLDLISLVVHSCDLIL